jgi:hypothetical protein
MLIDNKLKFSNEQDLGAGSASLDVASTNTVDLTAIVNDLGTTVSANIAASGIMLNVVVDGEAFTCSTSAGELRVKVMTKASASSIASGTDLGTIIVRALTAAASGTYNVDGAVIFRGHLPEGNYLRHIGLNYEGTTKMTAGKVTAWLGGASDTGHADGSQNSTSPIA